MWHPGPERRSRRPSRRPALILALTCAAPPAGAQTTARELAALRAHLALADSVRLAPAAELALPPSRPLRVRLAFGLDLKARQNVAGWIAEWNRKDGRRHGAVALVSEGAADVVLARYTEPDRVRTRTMTGPDIGPSGPGGTRTRSRSRFTVDMVPVHAYLVDSRRSDVWTVVWRHTGFTPLAETSGSGREAWDGLRDLLKTRAHAR